MPLIINEKTDETQLLAWRIDESLDQLAAFVTPGDVRSAGQFGSAARRRERLAWRAALRTAIPHGEVGYTETGAPYIEGRDTHISVAHTSGLALVLLSPRPCAVDVETAARDFTRTRDRFIGPHEASLTDATREDFAAAVWCAKEALYKYSGRRELDFIRDLRITETDLAGGGVTGTIRGGAPIRIAIRHAEGYIIAHTL